MTEPTQTPAELTLRDYFAAHVLTAAPWDYLGSDPLTTARQAYAVADAMLIAKAEPPLVEAAPGQRTRRHT